MRPGGGEAPLGALVRRVAERGAGRPAAVAVAALALAGALLGGGRLGPAGNPLAAPGLAALLGAPPVAVLAAALAWARLRLRAADPAVVALGRRGASSLQVRLVLAGPVALLALGGGLLLPLPAAALVAVLPLHAAGRGFLAAYLPSLALGGLGGALLAAALLLAPRLAVPHARAAPARALPASLAVVLAAGGLAAGLLGRGLLGAGGGLPLLRLLVYAGAPALLGGVALLAGHLCAAVGRFALRRHPEADAGTVLAFRAAARGRAAAWPAALAALAAGAAVFALSGVGAAAALGRTATSLAVGAPWRVEEVASRPCGVCSGAAADIRAWPLPSVRADQAGLPGVTAAAVLVPGADEAVLGAAGTVPVTTWGIDPSAFGAVALWPSGLGRAGPADLRRLRAAGGRGAIVSSALAAQAGIGPGARMQTRLLGVVSVVGVAAAWPGIGSGNPDWLVVNWTALRGPLQAAGPWTTSGFRFDALWRVAPGQSAGRALAALQSRGVRVPAATAAATLGAGSGALPFVLLPLAAAAVLLWWAGRGLPLEDPSSLPDGPAAIALGAAGALPRGRALLRAGAEACGGAAGAVGGWLAAVLFWPALGFGALGVPPTGLRVPALGLLAAVLCAAAGGAAGLRLPAPPPPLDLHLPESGRLAPERPAPPPAGRRRAVAPRALVVPALARLRFAWPRLLGVAGGLLLAAAVSATVPLYVEGSLTRVLQEGLAPHNSRPAGAALLQYLEPGGGGPSPSPTVLAGLQAAAAGFGAAAGLPASPVTTYEATASGQLTAGSAGALAPNASPAFVTLDALGGLGAHVRVVAGKMYGAGAPAPGAAVPAVATQEEASASGLRVGDLYTWTPPGGGAPISVRLVGVVQQLDPTGAYWPYRYYTSDLLVAPAALRALIFQRGLAPLGTAAWYTVLDLQALDAARVPAALAGLQQAALRAESLLPGAALAVSPYGTLTGFVAEAATLRALLRLVAVPVIALSLYFVAVMAGLVVAADADEISVYASRGAGPAQLLLLYVLEWVLLAVPVTVAAPFAAAGFARLMGASDGFLRFRSGAPPLPVHLAGPAFAWAGAAAGAGVLTALLPAAEAVRRSVVEAKRRAGRPADRPLWQRAYLDMAALALLGVLLVSFRSASLQPGAGAAAIAADPALYLLPAAFLGACGLLLVRLVGWAFAGLDSALGPRGPVPAVLPLRRIGRQPLQFAPALLLLCCTAALGAYSAAAARTMDTNLAAAVRYRVGAPLRLAEVSPCTTEQPEVGACLTYDNVPVSASRGVRPMPPFSLHAGVPGIAAASEILDEPVVLTGPGGNSTSATLVLVDPATYAGVGWWGPDLNPLPLATYLHALSSRPGALFLGPGLLGGVPFGTGVTVADALNPSGAGAPFTVVGSVVRWPGADTPAPFALAALGPAEQALGIVEAQRIALVRPAPGATESSIAAGLATRGILVSTADATAPQVAAALASPEWAGQSGLLSVGFLVALAVTAAGYLFYALLLLRGQLSQLGLLRALGLPWGRLVAAVAAEQGALLAAGLLSGTGAGLAGAALFLPLFRPAFSGPTAPPFVASGPGPAFIEVAGLVAALMVAVLGALLLLLRRLHVGETVKLEA